MTSRFLAVPLAIIAACGVACVSIHVATTASAPVAASPDIVDATTAPHRLGAFGDPVATTWSYLAGDGGASLVVPALSVLSGLTVCSGAGGGTVTVAPVGTLPDGAPLPPEWPEPCPSPPAPPVTWLNASLAK